MLTSNVCFVSRPGFRKVCFIPDHGQLFGRSSPLFGLSQKLFTASRQSIVLCLTVFFGSTYLGEEDFSQIKVIKSRYRNRLSDKRLKYCLLHLCLTKLSVSYRKLCLRNITVVILKYFHRRCKWNKLHESAKAHWFRPREKYVFICGDVGSSSKSCQWCLACNTFCKELHVTTEIFLLWIIIPPPLFLSSWVYV